jgi:peptide/nickel transport system substrate-binding protein
MLVSVKECRVIRHLVYFLPLIIFGCTDKPANETATQADTGGVAVVALPSDLDYLNILAANDRYTQEIVRYLLFLPLVQYDAKLDYQPVLAESYQFEGDTAVTFKLRKDVFWHDGVHTTAHDVAFTFERAADTLTAFPNADWLIGWGKPQVLDSFTVRFPLERMADPLGGIALFPIMPRHLLANVAPADLQKAPFNKQPVGNGPFRFVEYRANDRWVFEPNMQHPAALGGRPKLSRLVLRVIPDFTAQATELRTGNVHLALSVPIDQFKQMDVDPALRGIARDTRQYVFIVWNPKRGVLKDPRVRRALTMAIDREEIINLLRAGQGRLALGPVGPYHWAFHPRLAPLPFSQDSARALFAQAGIRDQNGDSKLDTPDGKPFRIELKIAAGSEQSRNTAEMIRADLEAVGVDLVVRPIEYATLAGDLTSPERRFDAGLMAWENDLRLNMHDMFHSTATRGAYQFASYSNAEVDRLIDQASATANREQAKPLWYRFQEIMREDQPWSFLYHYPDLYMAREELRGAEMDIRGAFVNVAGWWIRKGTTDNTAR